MKGAYTRRATLFTSGISGATQTLTVLCITQDIPLLNSSQCVRNGGSTPGCSVTEAVNGSLHGSCVDFPTVCPSDVCNVLDMVFTEANGCGAFLTVHVTS